MGAVKELAQERKEQGFYYFNYETNRWEVDWGEVERLGLGEILVWWLSRRRRSKSKPVKKVPVTTRMPERC